MKQIDERVGRFVTHIITFVPEPRMFIPPPVEGVRAGQSRDIDTTCGQRLELRCEARCEAKVMASRSGAIVLEMGEHVAVFAPDEAIDVAERLLAAARSAGRRTTNGRSCST